MLIKPPRLRPGDTVAALTLSWGGPAAFPERYAAGVRQLEAALGVRVVEMPHTRAPADWLSRHPAARAADLMQAFADPTVHAIIATIGGDDSLRLLPYLDLAVIAANPKIVLGYSDTTITHAACYRAGLGTFYGPAVMAGFAENGGMFPYTLTALQRTLMEAAPAGRVPEAPEWTAERLPWEDPTLQAQPRRRQPATGWRWLQGAGVHRGRLFGGCVEVLDWLRGTAFWPTLAQWQGTILFLETSEDAPTSAQVRSLLRTFAALDVLPRLAGLFFGRPGGAVPPAEFTAYDEVVRQVVAEEAGRPELPIITQMDFGHTDPMWVWPYGAMTEINCDARTVTVLEAAVTA